MFRILDTMEFFSTKNIGSYHYLYAKNNTLRSTDILNNTLLSSNILKNFRDNFLRE